MAKRASLACKVVIFQNEKTWVKYKAILIYFFFNIEIVSIQYHQMATGTILYEAFKTGNS